MTYYNILRRNGFILMPGSSTYTNRVYMKKNTRFVIKATVNKARRLCIVDIKCSHKAIEWLRNGGSSISLLNEQAYLAKSMKLMAKQLGVYDFVTNIEVKL